MIKSASNFLSLAQGLLCDAWIVPNVFMSPQHGISTSTDERHFHSYKPSFVNESETKYEKYFRGGVTSTFPMI